MRWGFRTPSGSAYLSVTISHNREALINWLGLFTTGSASLSYLTEALVHIYIPQPRGDLAVRCFWREGLTHSRGCCPFFRVAFPHLCVLIIAHCERFVKSFLKLFSSFFQPLLDFLTHSTGFRFEFYQPLTVYLL